MDSWFPTFRRWAIESDGYRSWWPWKTTAGQRQSLLRLIAVATEENLPLAPLIDKWAEDESGVQRRRLRRLAQLLVEGRSLPAAVEEIPGVLREDDLLAIRFDSQSGTRTAAMREALAESLASPASPGQRLRRALFYFCTVIPLGLLVIAFSQLKVIPVVNRMFSEFGLEQPPALQWSATSLGVVSGAWWLVALAAIVAGWWMFATRSGRHVRHALFGRLFRPLRELRSADALHNLAIAVEAGRPIPGALSTLARYHFDPAIRHDLLFVRNEVEQGADVWQSMTVAGLLTAPEAHLLRTSERLGNRPWVLKQLVGVKRRRTMRRLERAAEWVLPTLVFIMAALVLFQALTIFEPLTRLIHGLL